MPGNLLSLPTFNRSFGVLILVSLATIAAVNRFGLRRTIAPNA